MLSYTEDSIGPSFELSHEIQLNLSQLMTGYQGYMQKHNVGQKIPITITRPNEQAQYAPNRFK